MSGFGRILEDLNEAEVEVVALKRVAGRERDLADLSDLEAAHGELPTAGS
jgi:hypothetical protein